jgi:hypothetical protein
MNKKEYEENVYFYPALITLLFISISRNNEFKNAEGYEFITYDESCIFNITGHDSYTTVKIRYSLSKCSLNLNLSSVLSTTLYIDNLNLPYKLKLLYQEFQLLLSISEIKFYSGLELSIITNGLDNKSGCIAMFEQMSINLKWKHKQVDLKYYDCAEEAILSTIKSKYYLQNNKIYLYEIDSLYVDKLGCQPGMIKQNMNMFLIKSMCELYNSYRGLMKKTICIIYKNKMTFYNRYIKVNLVFNSDDIYKNITLNNEIYKSISVTEKFSIWNYKQIRDELFKHFSV